VTFGLLYRAIRGIAMPQSEIPTLRTERLTLAAHRLDDFEDNLAMWSDPRVTTHIGGRPFTREECWQRFLRYGGMWSLLGFGYWAARETATGAFIGDVGFANLGRDLDPPLGDAPEAGWVLSPAAHGKGYATEAMRAVTAWGDERFGGARTVSIIDPDNRASIGVAAKLGYVEYARTSYKGGPIVLFERVPGRNPDAA
jgi:RimJ/RimL family protein N-acetyltransferase